MPLNIPSWPQSGERERELLEKVLQSPQWGGFHPFVSQFEQEFAAYQHCSQGISAFNGTVTLELALTVLGIGPGDEVIVPAISFISTATAVSRAGATPVFVDIEPYSFNIDPERVAEAITPKTRAIIPVHFGGSLANMDALLTLAAEKGIALLEDAAHAHGSEWEGKRAGSLGLVGSFSFQNGKVMSAGEGGILTTNCADFAARSRSIANQGRIPDRSFYEHHWIGTNFRMTAFQAAVLIAQLERLPEHIIRRTKNVKRLKEMLVDVDGLVFQEDPAKMTQHSHYLLPGRIHAERAKISRNEFYQAMVAADIPCTPFYPHPLYGNPIYREGNRRVMPCPNAEACIGDAFWFPHRLLLAEEETIETVGKLVRSVLTGDRVALHR